MLLEQVAYPKGIQNLAGTRGIGGVGPLGSTGLGVGNQWLKKGRIY